MANRNVAPNAQWREHNAPASEYVPGFLVSDGAGGLQFSASGPSIAAIRPDGNGELHITELTPVNINIDGSNNVTLEAGSDNAQLVAAGDGLEFSTGGTPAGVDVYRDGGGELRIMGPAKSIAFNPTTGDVVLY